MDVTLPTVIRAPKLMLPPKHANLKIGWGALDYTATQGLEVQNTYVAVNKFVIDRQLSQSAMPNAARCLYASRHR